jgi:hypothetical protein
MHSNKKTLTDVGPFVAFRPAFQLEDDEILAHNALQHSHVSVPSFTTPRPRSKAQDQPENDDVSFRSDINASPKGTNFHCSNIMEIGNKKSYAKQARRKMVKDPVTGTTNINPRQAKSKKKSTNLPRSKSFDFRPLDLFHSKLIGNNRLSV